MAELSQKEKDTVLNFEAAVNMTAKEIEDWLKTEESQSVGQKESEEDESKGHQSGRKIVKILRKSESEYTEADLSHMKKVISYIHRHSAQKPSGSIVETPWRYSLMNWGHDPTK
ncbi:DUF3140 domain-containing protein [Egbenema bharatensis]|uniref:DUF3140 domain-containing protein n=1 Tax=Egbenema bharatensis TaxID=3463334 RepID=UPI003A83D099